MTRIFVAFAAALSIAKPAAAVEVIEWADHARDPKAIIGDPVYMRTLYCGDRQGSVPCTLTTVSVTRTSFGGPGGCPLLIEATVHGTEDGKLRVQRNGDTLDIEVDELKATTRLRIRLMTDLINTKIVEMASGVMVFKAVGEEPLVSTELVAYAKNSKGMEKYPEHAEVELSCSRLSVIAAKKTPKWASPSR
jgi:hypothetical protein